MKKGFTIVEVSILFIIFLIVAFLVAPLSLDDTKQAQNTSRWRSVQQDFSNIFYAVSNQKIEGYTFEDSFESIIEGEIKSNVTPYKITYMNGSYPDKEYKFDDFKQTYSNATLATKVLENSTGDVLAVIMYDVNGKMGPNVWGKDVYGLNIYEDRVEPFGKNHSVKEQKQDCSRHGTGRFCSNYYLIGGSFD